MKQGKYQIHISAEHKLFDLHINEILQYRDLIFLFVKRNFISQYKQTILGPLWAVIQPLLTTVVFTIVFGGLAGLPTADIEGSSAIPAFLFYMIGNICWTYFSLTLTSTSNTFLANSATMGKVYFPRMVVPISTGISGLISFAIQFVMLFVCMFVYAFCGEINIQISAAILLLPLLVMQIVLLSIGFGIIISALTTKYRDLAMLVGFGLELWRYGSPVAYGLQLLPQKYLSFYLINPMAVVLTAFRFSIFGRGFFNAGWYLLSWFTTIMVFMIGLVLFSRIERTFMDTI